MTQLEAELERSRQRNTELEAIVHRHRELLRFARKSRDAWKMKALERYREINRLRWALPADHPRSKADVRDRVAA